MKRAINTVMVSLACLALGGFSAGCSDSRDVARAVKATAEEGIDKSKEVVEQAAEKTGDAVDTVGEKAQDGLDKSKKALEKAAEKTGDAVVIAGEKSKEGLQKAAQEITDGWILSRIRTRFASQDLLNGSDIDVDCDKHVVTLKGTVVSEAGRQRAVQIATNVEGVRRVEDRLVIGPKKG